MDKAMLSCGVIGRRRGMLLAKCHLYSISELEQVGNAEANLTTPDAGWNLRRGAIRPLDGKPHAPARWVLHVDVPPAVLATGGADDRQLHALERMSRQGDGHAARNGSCMCRSLRMGCGTAMPLRGARCAGAGAAVTSGGRPHRLPNEAPAAGRHHAPALHRAGILTTCGVPGASASGKPHEVPRRLRSRRKAILEHLGLPMAGARLAPARGPPQAAWC